MQRVAVSRRGEIMSRIRMKVQDYYGMQKTLRGFARIEFRNILGERNLEVAVPLFGENIQG